MATFSRVRGGPGFKRSTRGRVLPSSVVEGEVDGQRGSSATDSQARFSSGVHADGRVFSFGFGRLQPSAEWPEGVAALKPSKNGTSEFPRMPLKPF
jgi:hypothetical protein